MNTFETKITLHDFSQPLAKRARDRRRFGPYQWLAAASHAGDRTAGLSFYAECTPGPTCPHHIEMARRGSRARLRLLWANDVLPSYYRITNTLGYYCDAGEHGTPDADGDALYPIIARLPRSRGYLAGYTMGAGMIGCLERDIWQTAEDAALAAHDAAERAAEVAREESAASWAEIHGECA